MMKSVYWRILTAVIILMPALVSCTLDSPDVLPEPSSGIKVVGRVTPFKNVETKGTKSNQESKISNMAMLVVDSGGAVVETQFVEDSKPLFIIDRNADTYTGHNQSLLAASEIYIIANIPSSYISVSGSSCAFLDNGGNPVTDISQFQDVDYLVSEIGQPSLGFPMFGVSEAIDLSSGSTLSGEVLEIPLTCLYSKIVFNITVNPVQKVEGVVQKFSMTSWTVHNVPTKLRVEAPAATAETVNATGTMLADKTFSYTDNGVNPVRQGGGGNTMTFSFYMPEHKINPTGSVTYPADLPDEDKQHYKPKKVGTGQKPAYVTINGIYTDHNGRDREVSYDVYLGENNYDNFHINRDCQYNNNVVIKGITNSNDPDLEGTVSIDYRVDVEQTEFQFRLERETLLDSHWEIRPIRITLDYDVHPNAAIKVSILEPSSKNWIRLEMPSAPSGSDYCEVSSTDIAYGKRKYFTTDLVSSTLAGNTSYSFPATAGHPEHTIWVYIDENVTEPTADGSTTREAVIRCEYFENGNVTGTADVTEDYTFIQRGLHRITNNGHPYNIEYYEEYLYNFDAKEQYGATTDGMAWGLEKTQLSSTYKSVNYSASGLIGGIIAYIINEAIQKVNLRYDFYLTRDGVQEGLTVRDYSGKSFTKEIVANTNAGIGVRATNSNPESAVEYCLNKNKRNSDGTISQANIKWYLPAIDEIEEICLGGYSDFEVFQDKYYWSSQPAYRIGKMDYVAKVSRDEEVFNFYYDDIGYENDPDNKIGRARATKIDNNGQNVKSESHGHASLLRVAGRYNEITDGPDYFYCYEGNNVSANKKYSDCGVAGLLNYTSKNATITWSASTHFYDDGDQLRDTKNRVRCVYKAD